MQQEKFQYSIASDVDYEDLIADIGFNDQLLAIISQEEGIEHMKIKIYPPQTTDAWEFKLDEFLKTLEKVKSRLIELRKESI